MSELMTAREFIEECGDRFAGQFFIDDSGAIRHKLTGGCPIAHYGQQVTGVYLDHDAPNNIPLKFADKIGIGRDETEKVICCADDADILFDDELNELRALMEAKLCGGNHDN